LDVAGPGTVSVIDAGTNGVIDTIRVGNNALDIAITPGGGFAYVTNFNSNSVSIIDTGTNTVVDTVTVGSGPLGIAITPDGRFAYVANRQPFNVTAPGTVSVIDTGSHTVVATIPVGDNPTFVAIAPNPTPTCTGDCNGDGMVTIDELLTGVEIALGERPLDACLVFDADRDGTVTIDEILAAANNALTGCSS